MSDTPENAKKTALLSRSKAYKLKKWIASLEKEVALLQAESGKLRIKLQAERDEWRTLFGNLQILTDEQVKALKEAEILLEDYATTIFNVRGESVARVAETLPHVINLKSELASKNIFGKIVHLFKLTKKL